MSEYKARIGVIITGKSPDMLTALALGSCVGTVIYDPNNKIAALVHIALPEQSSSSKKNEVDFPGRYANSAIPECIKLLQKLGANINKLHAKIAGGSRMFGAKDLLGPGLNIGDRNISAVKKYLKLHNITLVGEDVGGDTSRTITFNTENKILVIKKAFNIRMLYL